MTQTNYNQYMYGNYQPQRQQTPSGQPFYGTTIPQQQFVTQPAIPPAMNAPSLGPLIPGMLPLEQSYIENILRLNKGKPVNVYATFENNREWNAKIFKGVIEAAGRDHVILSDPETGLRYLIPMIYVDYITFSEEIEYEYPFTEGMAPLSQYSPR